MERLIEANDTAALRALEREQGEIARMLSNEAARRLRAERTARLLVVFLIVFALATPGLACMLVEQATEDTRVLLTEQREATWRAETDANYWRSAATIRGELAASATRCCLSVCGAGDLTP